MHRRSVNLLHLAVFMLSVTAGCTAEPTTPPTSGTGTPSCSDECAPPSDGWNGPALLWFGPVEKAPNCPSDAPNVEYEGHANLVASNECTACTCGPSEGTCSPLTEINFYMSEIACTPNEPIYTMTPPPDWDGSCYTDGFVAANTYSYIRMNQHHLTNDSCTASSSSYISDPTLSWETSARACGGKLDPACDGVACIHQDRESDGFIACVYRDGDRECPVAYPVQHVFYAGFDDQRACTSCECGAPVGSNCVGGVWFYADTECKESTNLMQQDAFGHGGVCVPSPPINPGPLWYSTGSISLNPIEYWPGICAATGGESIGQANPTEPTTFCCRDMKKE
jgi:hypothetical protein